MEITKRRLADIVPYSANAKKHDKRQINNVAESIKQYGFVQPIVIDRDGVIVIGHCRALAAKKLGMEEVPCVCVDDLTPEQNERHAYCMEFDPKYADVIVDRWEKFTGKKAVLLNDD